MVPELEDTNRGDSGFGHTGSSSVEGKVGGVGEDFVGVEQIWPYEGPGVDKGDDRMTLCVGKSHFLRPQKQKMICLPFKLIGVARFNLQVAMQVRGLLASIVLTKSRHLKLNVYNTLDQVVSLTPTLEQFMCSV